MTRATAGASIERCVSEVRDAKIGLRDCNRAVADAQERLMVRVSALDIEHHKE